MKEESRDFSDFYVGAVALGMGVLFVFWGARGLYGFEQGLRSDGTDPAICALGLIAGVWMLAMAWRVFRVPGRRETLLSGPELLVASLFTMAGAAWSITVNPRYAIAFAAIGFAGICRWFYLRRSGNGNSTAT